MLTGPSATFGEPGAADGRMDLLLDTGTYRLRAFADRNAHEDITLEAAPFTDAAPPSALPPPGETLAATLQDRQQRAFWLSIPSSGQIRIEAAGRALADLRLWRGGRELAALEPVSTLIEPEPAHPLTRLLLEGQLEPGTYLAIAYGGPALPWTDGKTDQPFLIRTGLSDALSEGVIASTIGPFGAEAYANPTFAGSYRLDLPQSAEASLAVDEQILRLTRKSREPHLVIRSTRSKIVTVAGRAGQPFTLRATEPADTTTLSRPGTYWVSAIASGAGADEVPPMVALLRHDGSGPAKIVASTLPILAPGTAWRQRFNLRGPTELLFQNALGGPVTLKITGQPVSSGGSITRRFDLPADFYVLPLTPVNGAFGAVDVTVGAPGAAPPLALPLPPDPVIPLGLQAIGPGQYLTLETQTAPGQQTGLSARHVPVALAAGPLMLTQAPSGPPLVVPIELAPGGTLAATVMGEGPLAVQDEPGPAPNSRRITIPPAGKPRSVILAWRRTPEPMPAIPAPPAPGTTATLRPGTPIPFDLARNEPRGFALDVPEGGLFRVETTGRLRTEGKLATAFIPALDQGVANGLGQNMLIQRWLRAGHYRVDLKALNSAGHGAITANPAPLQDGPTLLPGGTARASLPPGPAFASRFTSPPPAATIWTWPASAPRLPPAWTMPTAGRSPIRARSPSSIKSSSPGTTPSSSLPVPSPTKSRPASLR